MIALTYREAAKRLSVSESTLDRLISRKEIRATKVRGCRRITDEEIDRFLEANTEPVCSVVSFEGRRSR